MIASTNSWQAQIKLTICYNPSRPVFDKLYMLVEHCIGMCVNTFCATRRALKRALYNKLVCVISAVAVNEDQEQRMQRWQLWPLLLGLLHHSPECAQASFDPVQEAVTDTMSCLSVCAEALAAAAPWQEAEEVMHRT